MTAVSEDVPPSPPRFLRSVRLARASHVWLGIVLLSCSGCLFADSPQLDPPTVRGPFLANFSPNLYALNQVEKASPLDLTLPPVKLSCTLYSDDVNSVAPLAYLLRDVQGSGVETSTARYGNTIVKGEPIAPGDFGEGRELTYTANLTTPGCHSLTLFVAYDWDRDEWWPKAQSRSASATWWFDVDDPNHTAPLSTCPIFGGDPFDGGSDGEDPDGGDAAGDGRGGAEAGPSSVGARDGANLEGG
jgi:hypothetical protein